MPQFGSNLSIGAQNRSAVTDSNGNLIVSPDDGYGASPLGIAARNQVHIGVPNGTFNILPPDAYAAITVSNPLPYWDIYADEGITSTMEFDDTAQTWSVAIDPTAVGTALGTAVLSTRFPIINDDGLDVRHYVASTLVQAVKTAGTDKWTATLAVQYYDAAGVEVGTAYTIGTIGERGTATVLSGYTNASGPINTSAAELEVRYTLAVGTASPVYYLQVKSLMVATEFGVIGGGGGGGAYVPLSVITSAGDLIVGAAAGSAIRLGKGSSGQVLTVKGTATGGITWDDLPASSTKVPTWIGTAFTTSGTFSVPTGINYVTVVAVGAGQGGQGGGHSVGRTTTAQTRSGGNGGSTGYYALVRDIYVGDVGTAGISVGIGAGGSGGTATAFNKAAGVTTTSTNNNPTNGADGGNTTFGAYFSVSGARTAPTGFFDIAGAAGATGGAGGPNTGGAGSIGGTHIIGSTNTGAPFITFWAGGVAGGTATGSGGTGASGNGGAAGTALAIAGAGGGGGGASADATALTVAAGAGGVGGPGGGASGGGASARYATATATIVATGAAGANAAANTGAGGGGGGACVVSFAGTATYNPSTLTTTSGAGGNGGSGVLYVYWLVNV